MFLLHYVVGLVNVDPAGAIVVNLVEHALHLPAIVVLSELHSHAVEVAGGDLVGVVVVGQLGAGLACADHPAKQAHNKSKQTVKAKCNTSPCGIESSRKRMAAWSNNSLLYCSVSTCNKRADHWGSHPTNAIAPAY